MRVNRRAGMTDHQMARVLADRGDKAFELAEIDESASPLWEFAFDNWANIARLLRAYSREVNE